MAVARKPVQTKTFNVGKPAAKPAAKPTAAVTAAQGKAAAAKASLADPTYQAARNSLQSQLGQYGANLKSQANRYDAQYGEDLGNLGLQDAHGARFANPDQGAWNWKQTLAKTGDSFSGQLTAPTADVSKNYGNWNQIDQNTSSGKAYTNQDNDYAARGMLQSSGYLADHANLGTSFNKQLGDAQLSRQNYGADLQNQAQAYTGQTSDSLNQARLAALSAYNAQQATNAVRAAAGIK